MNEYDISTIRRGYLNPLTSNKIEAYKLLLRNIQVPKPELNEDDEHDIMKLVSEIANLVQVVELCEDDFATSTTHAQLNRLYDKKLDKLEELLDGVNIG